MTESRTQQFPKTSILEMYATDCDVNVVVDGSRTSGMTVVVEDDPDNSVFAFASAEGKTLIVERRKRRVSLGSQSYVQKAYGNNNVQSSNVSGSTVVVRNGQTVVTVGDTPVETKPKVTVTVPDHTWISGKCEGNACVVVGDTHAPVAMQASDTATFDAGIVECAVVQTENTASVRFKKITERVFSAFTSGSSAVIVDGGMVDTLVLGTNGMSRAVFNAVAAEATLTARDLSSIELSNKVTDQLVVSTESFGTVMIAGMIQD